MSVHAQLTAEIARQLTPKLRPRYLALMTKRFVLEMPDGVDVETTDLYPDVGVARSGASAMGVEAKFVPAPLQMATVMPVSIPHFTVEIRDVSARRLVTAIEVLSPTNKRGDGRAEYLSKRQKLLMSTAHLMEIDFLREGRRVPMQEPLPSIPYFVFVSRAERRPITEVWPITLDQPLPEVQVPLLPGDFDVWLDLQQAMTNIYDQCGLDLAVDYAGPPEVPLAREATAWAEDRLRAAGLRS